MLSKLFNQLTGAKDAPKTDTESGSVATLERPTTIDPQTAVEQAIAAQAAAPVAEPIIAATPPAAKLTNPIDKGLLEEEIIEAMRQCYDPEIPVNIYDMGLIYEIDIDKDRFVNVEMTLTSPGCPVAGTLPPDVERRVAAVEGVSGAKVTVVWEPTWTMDMMSEDAKLELGFF